MFQNSDAIILAREFLAYEIVDKHKMIAIQLQVGAKCRKVCIHNWAHLYKSVKR